MPVLEGDYFCQTLHGHFLYSGHMPGSPVNPYQYITMDKATLIIKTPDVNEDDGYKTLTKRPTKKTIKCIIVLNYVKVTNSLLRQNQSNLRISPSRMGN